MVGAVPVKEGTGRIARYELLPLEALGGRPRVDVLCNMSGIFRWGERGGGGGRGSRKGERGCIKQMSLCSCLVHCVGIFRRDGMGMGVREDIARGKGVLGGGEGRLYEAEGGWG